MFCVDLYTLHAYEVVYKNWLLCVIFEKETS
jgi:hypothetical protein